VQYLRAYKFPFDSPQWFANVGFVTLCLLTTSVIPVVGQMLAVGYLYDVLEAMHHQASDRPYPDFRWERFVAYLVRGALIFLVQFLVMLPALAIFLIGFFAAMVVTIGSSPEEPNLVLFAGLYGGTLVLAMVSSLFLSLLIVPLTLRVGLSQDLGQTFSWSFIKDYARRVWGPTLQAELFLLVSTLVVTLAGLALCCFGVYAVMALPLFARIHLNYQLYELYLERGGTPIPLQREPRPWPDEARPHGSHEGIRDRGSQSSPGPDPQSPPSQS
jgi:Protein of unknown function (DUF4013)